jgi:hypothetical protein
LHRGARSQQQKRTWTWGSTWAITPIPYRTRSYWRDRVRAKDTCDSSLGSSSWTSRVSSHFCNSLRSHECSGLLSRRRARSNNNQNRGAIFDPVVPPSKQQQQQQHRHCTRQARRTRNWTRSIVRRWGSRRRGMARWGRNYNSWRRKCRLLGMTIAFRSWQISCRVSEGAKTKSAGFLEAYQSS